MIEHDPALEEQATAAAEPAAAEPASRDDPEAPTAAAPASRDDPEAPTAAAPASRDDPEGPSAEPAGEAAEPEPAGEAEAASADDGGRTLEADLDELRERAGRSEEYLALAQRTQADFENYRKRMNREVRAAEARGMSRLARELLPALDNLERALAAADSVDDDSHLKQGIQLVQAELAAALSRTGIEGYAPKGERFDPAHHEAMAQQPVEGAEPGTIVEVLQPGYRLNEAILRPARVIVAA